MPSKKPADKSGAKAPAATVEKQDNLPTASTTTEAAAALTAALGSADATGAVEQGAPPSGADTAGVGLDSATHVVGSEAPAVTELAGGNATDALDGLRDEGEIEGLVVTAIPEQGFRRCGFRFTREGLAIALSALTQEQIEQLESEPCLKVERGVFSGLVE